MDQADELFGAEEVVLTKLTDAAGVLRMKNREPVRKLIEKFESRFPQLFFSVYLGAFQDLQSLRQFGFWLLNRAAYQDVDLDRPNENGILLVVDVNAKNAGLTFGYALMPYLDEDSTFAALAAAHPDFLEGDYAAAIRTVMKKIEAQLIRSWKRVKKDPESVLGRTGQQPKKVQEMLQRIREGNRERTQSEIERRVHK